MYDQNNTNPFTSAARNVLFALQERAGATHPQSPPVSTSQNLWGNPSAVQPCSIINLSNSSDVVIGPMTQYQGPVTIYQYMDATVQARSMQPMHGGITDSQNKDATNATEQSKLHILLLILVIIASAIVTCLLLERRNETTNQPVTFPNLGNGHLIVDRHQWGSSDHTKNLTVRLSHPIPYVMITHIGVQSSPFQLAEMGQKDILSNFYIGSDGNVYVGRGWNYANAYANNTLAVTFMGDYNRYEPNERQFDATKYLLAYGITEKHLAIDYKLVAQNQTRATESPGSYVYREIIKWPHWYPCGIDDNPKCGSELGMPEVWNTNM